MSYVPRNPGETFPTGKEPVRVASTGNITLAAPGSTIDGVTLAVNDRVLLKDQTTTSQNGIWVWNGSGVTMTRATDADSAAELKAGLTVYISQGTVNAKRTYTLTTTGAINVGVTALLFEELDDTGVGGTVTGFTTVRVAAGGVSTTTLPASIDGVTMVTGDRFLVPSSSGTGNAPSSATTNGLWVYTTAGSAATRPTDYANASVVNGLLVLVTEGTANAYDSGAGRGTYTLAQAVTVGSTSHVWGKLYDTRATTTATTPTSTQARRFFGQVHMSQHLTAQEGISIGSGNGTNPINISHGANITANITLTADTSNRGFLVYTGVGGHTVTLPVANTMISGSYGLFNVIVNRGAGAITVAPTSPSTLNGVAATVSIPVNSWAICYGVGSTDTAVSIVDAAAGASSTAPIGSIVMWGNATAPIGWIILSGQELAISAYPDLYTKWGTTYGTLTNGAGAAGTTHFRAPNPLGRTIVGAGAAGTGGGASGTGLITGGTALTARTLGAWTGAESHALTAAQTPLRSHTHSGTTSTESATHLHNSVGHGYLNLSSSAGPPLIATMSAFNFAINSGGTQSANHTHTITTGTPSVAEANGTAHENTQPSLALYYIAKAQLIEESPAWGSASGKVARVAVQTVPTASWQDAIFDTILETSGVTTATSTVPLTCTLAGKYDVKASMGWLNTAAGDRLMRVLHKNQAGTILAMYADQRQGSASAYSDANLSVELNMAVGDFLQLQIYQSSGAPLNTSFGSGTYGMTISMSRTGYQTNPIGAVTPVGAAMDYFGTTEPADGNWKFPNGQAISRTIYSELFTLMGTTHGVGDGSTTFNLPDLRARVGVGLDNMGGSDAGRLSVANTLGASGGVEAHALTAAQTPLRAHTHSGTTGTESATHTHAVTQYLGPTLTTYLPAAGSGVGGTVNTSSVASVGTQSANHTHTITTGNPSVAEANGTAHENMQPYMLVNKLIRVR